VRQVGYLQELYVEAQSKKQKILQDLLQNEIVKSGLLAGDGYKIVLVLSRCVMVKCITVHLGCVG